MKNKESVYFFMQKGTNYVKIGYTRSIDISSRFSTFCTYAPLGGKIVGFIKTESGISLEKKIHNELSHKRLYGEFFNISEKDCLNIIERYNSEETNCIISNFNIWLSKNSDSIDQLNDVLKNAISKINKELTDEDLYYYDLINIYFTNENRSKYMTATEMKDYIISFNPTAKIVSMKKFGMELKKLFGSSKSKKVDGKILYKYFVGIK